MTLEMCDAVVDSLLAAVRRRLWHRQLVEFARRATWASVALMLLAIALIYFAELAQRVEVVLIALGVIWAAALGWVLLRRPSTGACALWVDRHLGGTSAYSTLLEIRYRGVPEQSVDAAHSLARWLAASAPDARRRLNAQGNPAYLVRPVLLMIMSAVLLTAVLTLPGVAPAPSFDPAARPESAGSNMAVPQAPQLDSGGLANELEAALKKGRSRSAAVGAASAGSAYPGDSRENEPMNAGADGAQAQNAAGSSENVTQGSARSSIPEARAGTGFAALGTSSGHDAGEARDDGGDSFSRRPSGAISVKQRDVAARTAATARQADMTQPAAFEDDGPVRAATGNVPPLIGLPASPPAAENTMPLTPTQAAYVQAWLKTRSHR